MLIENPAEQPPMDTATGDNMEIDAIKTFRHNSLMLVTYPWRSVAVMEPDLSQLFEEEHLAYRFSVALNKFDSKLAATSMTQAYVRSALRDISDDRYSQMTTAQIVAAERKDMKSTDHASAVCSVVTAYRLLDVIYALEKPDGLVKVPPQHEPLEVNFSSYKISDQLADWTSIARKFQTGFNSRKDIITSSLPFNNFSSRQLFKLSQLHTTAINYKALYNLQLAATHIAFILDHDSDAQDIPDFPSSLNALGGSGAMSASECDALQSHFQTLLDSLESKDKYDYLRLALQVSAILSPIFLLQEILIHKSKYYCQRYRLMLYGRGVGNARPQSIIRLETIIWRALLEIASGAINLYEGAESIAKAIPDILKSVEEKDRSWFQLANPAHTQQVHLSSFNVVESSVPEQWPMFERLVLPPPNPIPDDPSAGDQGRSNPNATRHNTPDPAADQHENPPPSMPDESRSNAPPSTGNDMQVDEPSSNATAPTPDTLQTKPTRPNAKKNYGDFGNESLEGQEQEPAPPQAKKPKGPKSTATSRNTTRSRDLRTQLQRRQPRPILAGTQFMKVEVIELTEIETEERTTFSVIPHPPHRPTKLSFALKPYGAYKPSQPFEFEFLDQKEHTSFDALEQSVSHNFVDGQPRHFSDEHNSYFVVIPKQQFDAMRTPLIHAHLQDRCIVIPDMQVGCILFDRQGFRKLDSLDTLVQIEDQTLPPMDENTSDQRLSERLFSGTLRQFIDNVESSGNKKVLRIVRMQSEASPGYTSFGSEFVAWRETKSRAYCKHEDPSLIKLLAWNDIATAHATQWWTQTPHGFGLYFDVRQGCQWVVIATPPQDSAVDRRETLNYFADPDFFIPPFQPMGEFNRPIATEAILVSEGMRIIIPPNMPYATFTTADCITTGGYILSIPNISKTFFGAVHSFILGTSTGDRNLCPALYFRRVIHYLHTSLVVNNRGGIDDDDDYHHLLTFQDVTNEQGEIVRSSIRDVESLICLFTMALFMNALDKGTYMPFTQSGGPVTPEEWTRQQSVDLNSLSHIERLHFCYVRGLAFDLVDWFFHNYEIQGGDTDTGDAGDPYLDFLVPLVAPIARDVVRYKKEAEESGIQGFCSASAFEDQIEMALFGFEGLEEAYWKSVKEKLSSQSAKDALELPFFLEDYTGVVALDGPQYDPIPDYVESGKNNADMKYFSALKGTSEANAAETEEQP